MKVLHTLSWLAYCVIVLFGLKQAMSADTFVCQKADIRPNGACVDDTKRVTRLERRLTALEKRLEEQTRVSRSIPDVIKLQQNSRARDCFDIYRGGERTDGVYQISPEGFCSFDVYCDMTNGGWTVIQRRKDGSVNFRRNWTEYVKGFGDLNGEFWLGLGKIHKLTQHGSQIYIKLGHYDTNKAPEWVHYQDFVVHDVASAYKMNVGNDGYQGSLPDLLTYHDGWKFSTIDRDHDYYTGSCAEKNGGGGWWFNNCYRFVLNGVYGQQSMGGISYWDRGNKYIKNVEIKVKPPHDACS